MFPATGTCGDDGLYYGSAEAFVVCSNGEPTNQKCAAGSANHHYGFYTFGQAYSQRSFCSVNLVGHGYRVQPYAPAPYAPYGQRYYGQGYGYGYQPYGYYPYGFPFPYYGYPYGYAPYRRPYGRPQIEATSDKAVSQ